MELDFILCVLSNEQQNDSLFGKDQQLGIVQFNGINWKLLPTLQNLAEDVQNLIDTNCAAFHRMIEVCVQEETVKHLDKPAENKSSIVQLVIRSCHSGDWRKFCSWSKFRKFLDMFYVVNKLEVDLVRNPEQISEDWNKIDEEICLTRILYELLQKAHKQFDLSKSKSDSNCLVLPKKFLPKLCEYQKRTVKWMMQRERTTDWFKPFVKVLKCKDGMTSVCHYKYQCRLSSYLFDGYDEKVAEDDKKMIPAGGILADEMGLGKTVEILALIMLNPLDTSAQMHDQNILKYLQKKRRYEYNKHLMCICHSNKNAAKKNLIQCNYCNRFQHRSCVMRYGEELENSLYIEKEKKKTIATMKLAENKAKNKRPNLASELFANVSVEKMYLCPNCWYTYSQEIGLIKTKATFIVTPTAIVQQWLSEIFRHTQPHLHVLVYNGVLVDKWISPLLLTTYDIVLTNYNVLRKELYFTHDNVSKRITRNKPKNLRVYTPLLMMEWWRVCLDEAQMVESDTSKISTLAKMIPAVNRWAVTGTPIEKSFNDLLPLLKFIGLFDEKSYDFMWLELVRNFIFRNQTGTNLNAGFDLIELLQKCMWRTSKDQVLEELPIPSSREIIHRIEFNSLERLFYNEQHSLCQSKFLASANKYRFVEGTKNISAQNMRTILKPFLTIRQSCTLPILVTNSNVHQKQFLQRHELHNYLLSTIENDCKAQLRTIASMYNGMAGIQIVIDEYLRAEQYYQKVLDLVKDNKKYGLTIDTLLQIHALFNMCDIMTLWNIENIPKDIDKIQEYEEQCIKLEWKYLSTYATALNNVKNSYVNTLKLLSEHCNIAQNYMEILSNYLFEFTHNEEKRLIDKVHEEYNIYSSCAGQDKAKNKKLTQICSISSLLYVLDIWFQYISAVTQKIIDKFKEFDFFYQNIKPRNEIVTEVYEQILETVQTVSDCHLNNVSNQNKNKSKTKVKKKKEKKECEICSLGATIKKLEYYLFARKARANTTDGVNIPSFESYLNKVVCTVLKNSFQNSKKEQDIQQINAIMRYFELLQQLTKTAGQFWVEMEYTMKAFVELNMCKMRIEIVENSQEKLSNLNQIYSHQLYEYMIRQKLELDSAQDEFETKLARLKYIRELDKENEEKMEKPLCPICHQSDYRRLATLECAHSVCYTCLKAMNKFTGEKSFRCAICRHEQSNRNIFYVHYDENWDKNQSKGSQVQRDKFNYTSKLSYMLRLILQIKEEANLSSDDGKDSVKILIFSERIAVLNAISKALKDNNIKHRCQYTVKNIADFKNPILDITCLLLPYTRGSKGLNLIEATHVFLVEPILNHGEELQAIGRIHRFGQTKPTTIHRFIIKNTIEENIYNLVHSSKIYFDNTIINKRNKHFKEKNLTLDAFQSLFTLEIEKNKRSEEVSQDEVSRKCNVENNTVIVETGLEEQMAGASDDED